MDLSKAFLEAIKMIREDEDWVQKLGYEKIPFRCQRCHEYSHLFWECPLNEPKKNLRKESDPVDPGFTKVASWKRSNTKQEHQDIFKKMNTSNSFEVLGNHDGETLKIRSPLCKFPSSNAEMPVLSPATDQEKINDLTEGSLRYESVEEVEDMDIK